MASAPSSPEHRLCAPAALDGIKQDPTIIAEATDWLKQDPVLQSRIQRGYEVVAVYDSGQRFRCHCYVILVKFRRNGFTWIEMAKASENKIQWMN